MSIENTVKITKPDVKKGQSGYKVMNVNVSWPLENLYAVCTPVKNQ